MKKAPSSLYRFQLSAKFPIKEATKLIPYLKELGVEGVYCSPYFCAYSSHGYDITDPNKINPLLATPDEFETFCQTLKDHNMVHFADLVPNHMGIKGENTWWKSVLEKGRGSYYCGFFDIDWEQEKLLVPLLGTPYAEALSSKALTLVWKEDKLIARYFDQEFPLHPFTYSSRTPIESIDDIDAVLSQQSYQLVHWQMSAQEISYRRFFNINELIGLRIEEENVFKEHHKWALELVKQGKIDGLRIDHPDGLYDPAAYFERLRETHKGVIVVEKILGWDEELPASWDVEGTVGYEYLNRLSGLFIKSDEALTKTYETFTSKEHDFQEMLIEKKLFYMHTEMAGDLKNLNNRFYDFSSKMAEYQDLPKQDLLNALYTILAHFPVYRSYIPPEGDLTPTDRTRFQTALYLAQTHNRELNDRALDFFEEVFTLQLDTPYLRDCILRFQQLSAPIMAKGFEDITLYNDNRFIALNEVGGEPNLFGTTKEEFHTHLKRKREKWPLGFLSTSTHDTKRSLDARMQMAVLSEIPAKWDKAVKNFAKLNEKHKTKIQDTLFPEPNAEYFLYQTLIGVWPDSPTFKRLWPLWQKSLREARVHTSWRHPDTTYEKAAQDFLEAILKPSSPFLKAFSRLQKEIESNGRLNTLSATTLKLASPGIVDIYEGCENWRFTLVDPDNRSPIQIPRTLSELAKEDQPKLDLHKRLLHFRKEHKELFLEGEYIPLKITGAAEEHLVAFLRTHKRQTCLALATRYFATFTKWGNTTIHLPKKLGKGRSVLTGAEINVSSKTLKVEKLLSEAPFGWIYWEG